MKNAEETLGSSCAGKFRNKVAPSLLVQLKFSYKSESVCWWGPIDLVGVFHIIKIKQTVTCTIKAANVIIYAI